LRRSWYASVKKAPFGEEHWTADPDAIIEMVRRGERALQSIHSG
jgi:hypothetical protein